MKPLISAALLVLAAACSTPVDRGHLPDPLEAGWSTVDSASRFSVGGHLDLTESILRGLRGRPADRVTIQDVEAAHEVEARRHIDLALTGKTDETCRLDFEELDRLVLVAGDASLQEAFRGLRADPRLGWRQKLRSAVTHAYRATRKDTEAIVFRTVQKVAEFQKRNAWRNPDAISLVLNCNTATDLLQFESKCYYFFLCLLYPSASGHIGDVRRLVSDMPEGLSFNTASTNGFHFDDLFRYDDIARRWKDLEAWTRHQARRSHERWDDGGRDDYLRVIGISSHSIQDFYCHSNWVRILLDFVASDNPEDFPLWSDLAAVPEAPGPVALGFRIDAALVERTEGLRFDTAAVLARLKGSNGSISAVPEQGGLQTGAWDHEEAGGVRAWGHRHPEESTREGRIAPALAARATEAWIDEALGFLPEARRRDFIDYISRRQ